MSGRRLLVSRFLVAITCSIALVTLAACSQAEPVAPSTDTPARATVLTIDTGLPITSVAAIPATAHLGVSHIVTAHGDLGILVHDATGKLVWRGEGVTASLVAHYQGQLVVYRSDEDISSLDRYRIGFPAPPVLVDTLSPSPIAPTTIQRTAFAALGPVQIDGRDILVENKRLTFEGDVSAVAGARYFPPVVAGATLVVGTEAGVITVEPFPN